MGHEMRYILIVDEDRKDNVKNIVNILEKYPKGVYGNIAIIDLFRRPAITFSTKYYHTYDVEKMFKELIEYDWFDDNTFPTEVLRSTDKELNYRAGVNLIDFKLDYYNHQDD